MTDYSAVLEKQMRDAIEELDRCLSGKTTIHTESSTNQDETPARVEELWSIIAHLNSEIRDGRSKARTQPYSV